MHPHQSKLFISPFFISLSAFTLWFFLSFSRFHTDSCWPRSFASTSSPSFVMFWQRVKSSVTKCTRGFVGFFSKTKKAASIRTKIIRLEHMRMAKADYPVCGWAASCCAGRCTLKLVSMPLRGCRHSRRVINAPFSPADERSQRDSDSLVSLASSAMDFFLIFFLISAFTLYSLPAGVKGMKDLFLFVPIRLIIYCLPSKETASVLFTLFYCRVQFL